MIGTLRKHSSWLWFIIITATIITFVFWGTQTSRFGGGGRDSAKAELGVISGRPIEPEDFLAARREVYLRHLFFTGKWPERLTD